jgi:hypothetical protein
MSAAAVLGNLKFASGDVEKASFVGVVDVARDDRIAAREVARVMEPVSAPESRATVVQLKPRDFEETARHILRVATPIVWPAEDADEE